MKKFLIAASLVLVSATASAFPDFGMERAYEKSFVANDARVLAYAEQLGASSVKVVEGKLQQYTVKTNNGCAFNVKVVYVQWPGIDSVVIGQAACK